MITPFLARGERKAKEGQGKCAIRFRTSSARRLSWAAEEHKGQGRDQCLPSAGASLAADHGMSNAAGARNDAFYKKGGTHGTYDVNQTVGDFLSLRAVYIYDKPNTPTIGRRAEAEDMMSSALKTLTLTPSAVLEPDALDTVGIRIQKRRAYLWDSNFGEPQRMLMGESEAPIRCHPHDVALWKGPKAPGTSADSRATRTIGTRKKRKTEAKEDRLRELEALKDGRTFSTPVKICPAPKCGGALRAGIVSEAQVCDLSQVFNDWHEGCRRSVRTCGKVANYKHRAKDRKKVNAVELDEARALSVNAALGFSKGLLTFVGAMHY